MGMGKGTRRGRRFPPVYEFPSFRGDLKHKKGGAPAHAHTEALCCEVTQTV